MASRFAFYGGADVYMQAGKEAANKIFQLLNPCRSFLVPNCSEALCLPEELEAWHTFHFPVSLAPLLCMAGPCASLARKSV